MLISYIAFNTFVSLFFTLIWKSDDWFNVFIKIVMALWLIFNVALLVGTLSPIVAASGMRLL